MGLFLYADFLNEYPSFWKPQTPESNLHVFFHLRIARKLLSCAEKFDPADLRNEIE